MPVIVRSVRVVFYCLFFAAVFSACLVQEACSQGLTVGEQFEQDPEFREYVIFFREVYATMVKNYYHPVTEEDFNKFLYIFQQKIYRQLRLQGKSGKYIKWRSAAHMVDALKAPEDIFSAFMPPKAADNYEKEVLGKRIDLGIEGELTEEGYRVTWVEPRSDPYEKGLREEDLVVRIDGDPVAKMSEAGVDELLRPLEGEEREIVYIDHTDGETRTLAAVSKEYFKQFTFMVPVDVDGVYCIKIERFNRMTAEDMTKFMKEVLRLEGENLIIDLRGNPGGPPLAARLISGFFLPPEDEFAYFQRRNRPRASLDVPALPPEYRYDGDLVILIDENSGSASELFSGILQGKGRATLMGESSAGQVFLKSMFYFDDGSMVLLITARGHHPDGEVFSFQGLDPDISVDEEEKDLIHYAALYLTGQVDPLEEEAQEEAQEEDAQNKK